MVGYYNYSVILTYVGLGCAVIGMALGLNGNLQAALLLLTGSGICDMLDGTIARHCKRTEDEKSFGMYIDSLCDLVCFGVAPAVLCYAFGFRSFLAYICMFIYVLCAVIRLAYFDVQEHKRLESGGEKRKFYEGLPVTNSAFIICGLLALDALLPVSFVPYYPILLLLIAAAFVIKFKVPKIYAKGLIIGSIGIVILIVVLAVFGDNITCISSITP